MMMASVTGMKPMLTVAVHVGRVPMVWPARMPTTANQVFVRSESVQHQPATTWSVMEMRPMSTAVGDARSVPMAIFVRSEPIAIQGSV